MKDATNYNSDSLILFRTNFKDPRAIGNWDMFPLGSTEEAIWAMDEDEAGRDGTVSVLHFCRERVLYLYDSGFEASIFCLK